MCRELQPFAHHLITTRAWRLGTPSTTAEDDAWMDIQAALPVRLIRARQVHGTGVLVHRTGAPISDQPATADIIVSNDPGVALAIQAADCVPILIADRVSGAVAAAHAGWRGLVAGVPRAALGALAQEFGSRPADLVAVAGPSIRACCYEVGAEVRQRFEDAGWPESMIARWFFARPQPTDRNPSMPGLPEAPRSGHWYFDSGLAARDQLEAAGLPAARISVAELCTASHPDALCSYRRDGTNAGRIAGVIRAVVREGGGP
jgi:YfiH family protein